MATQDQTEELIRLLSQLSASQIKESIKDVIKPPDSNIWTPGEYECLQCKTIYIGDHFHSTRSPIRDRKYVAWCPNCLNQEVFWLHQYFKVREVRQPNELQR